MAEKEFLKPEKNNHRIKTRYLLVIAIICLSFSIAFVLRAYPIKYGFYLNEFDPFFDYRATSYIVDNGIDAYFKWHDFMSWYPEGRDIPGTSQSGLHITAAVLYQIFGMNSSLMDFTIWFPVIIGSGSTVLMFLLVRCITGKNVPGLIASVFFAVSPAIIQRGNLGWFKSEPLGIFYGLGGTYLFISALKERKYKFLIPKAIFSGVLLGLAGASWGGAQYFVIPISIFIVILAFVSKDLKNPLLVSVLFTASVILVALAFPRPGTSFVFGLQGMLLMGSTAFLLLSTIVKRKSSEKKAIRNTAIVFGIIVVIGIAIISSGLYQSPSFRYLNAVNPFLSAQSALVESVAEHSTPTIVDYFRQFSVLILFSGLGIWIAFKNKSNTTMIFALVIGLTGIYISATFARLLVFASIGMVILSSIGIYEIVRSITSIRRDSEIQNTGSVQSNIKHSITNKIKTRRHFFAYLGFSSILIIMLTIPMVYDRNTNWISSADVPTSIANGGTNYRLTTNDWIDSLDWISKNTTEDSVIASWWDYGYWITTLGNRTSLADNATINQTRIESLAKMFMSPEEEGVKIANKLKADYILVYVVGEKTQLFDPISNSPIIRLGTGGDESKKHWFIKIGGFENKDFLESNGETPKQQYWDSLLGHMMPFRSIGYLNPTTGMLAPEYQPNSLPLYVKDIKYPKGNSSQPLTLEYASKSFESNDPGLFFGVLLYKVNNNFTSDNNHQINNSSKSIGSNSSSGIKPTAASAASATAVSNGKISEIAANNKSNIINNNNTILDNSNMTTNNTTNTANIETSQGQIKIQFLPDVAPKHVKNFQDLARNGFYDGVAFHRLVKGFVIQAGDPNTKNDSNKEAWGTGGPGYTINQEFNNIPHERGIVSMARTMDPNSAGSQFFIVLKDSKFLDNQYTVFGKVTEGMDVVDKIANVSTNAMDQPVDSNLARINKITIN